MAELFRCGAHSFTPGATPPGRSLSDLVGPLVETAAVLHRERRSQERLNAATALPAIPGASLAVGKVLENRLFVVSSTPGSTGEPNIFAQLTAALKERSRRPMTVDR